jgi:hypothetical protein
MNIVIIHYSDYNVTTCDTMNNRFDKNFLFKIQTN